MRAKPHTYTTSQIKFLGNIAEGRSRKEIQQLFNDRFNLELTLNQITGTLKRYKFSTGRTGYFPKGHVPYNKGMKGVDFCGENGKKTQFKKGQAALNYRPIGSERINVEGYIEVKVADHGKWRHKHRVLWEEVYGPIPRGHVIIFADSNKLNVEIDNLLLVTRKQLLMLNRYQLIQDNAEATKTAIIIADVLQKIGERKKAAE